MNKWEETGMGNQVLEGKGFFISFNPSLTHLIGSSFAPETSKGETALIDEKEHKYRILNGDFRKQYEKLLPRGFKACEEFFEKKEKSCGSDWSTER